MKALCLLGPKHLAITNIPAPKLENDDDVLVEVAYCGICWSDVLEYTSGPIFAPLPGEVHPHSGVSLPLCMGHEYSGIVKEVGPKVSTFRPGDHIAVDIGVPCRKQHLKKPCHSCTLGKENSCARLAMRGLSASGGGLCQFVCLPEGCLHLLPKNVPLELGALTEPLSISWHAVRISDFKPGQTALVIGAGPIGLACILALQGHGAGKIIVTEPGKLRREKAQELGADHVLDPTEFSTTRDLVAKVTQLSPPYYEGVDVSFDCGGVQETLDTALNSLRPGGMAVNLAVWPQQQAIIFPMDITTREVKYMGSMGFSSTDMAQVIEAFSTGKIPPDNAKGLITSMIDLDNAIEDGFHSLLQDRDKHIKVLIKNFGDENSED